MLKLPRISVITPAYNQGNYIEETIQSVLGQGYPDLEYIIMDGGSTDQTLEILKKYGDKVKWVSEKDFGQSNAINKGLRLATGDVLTYLNSDDVYEMGSLKAVGRFFSDHPQAYWVTGRSCIVNSNSQEIRRLISGYKNFWLFWANYSVLTVLNYVSQPATFWRRAVVDRVGYINEKLFYTMDYDYWLRIGKHYKLWVLPITLSKFRVHPSSKTMYSTRSQFDEELQTLRSHTTSKMIVGLHSWHTALILLVYSWGVRTKERGSNE